MRAVPTYLRWIASIVSGITSYFVYAVLTLGIVKGTGKETITGGPAALVSFGASMVTLITALAVNDWLARRYPIVRDEERVGDDRH